LDVSRRQIVIQNIAITDFFGRIVATPQVKEASNGIFRINMVSQPAGIYILIIKHESGIIHKKLMKY